MSVLGNRHSQFYEFDQNKKICIKKMHQPMNIRYVERERTMHWPAVNADMSKIAALHLASYVKKHRMEFKKANIVEPYPSVGQSTAESVDIDICLNSRIFECL